MNRLFTNLNPQPPKHTGVYCFKSSNDTLLYIGKAKSLYNRIQSYFQKYATDWKIEGLLTEAETIEYILTQTETEALLLEAELIQKYKPKYNALLKEGNPFVYIMCTKEPIPTLKISRSKKTKGIYFGPFLHKTQARKTLAYLLRTFCLNRCNKAIENGCLDYHIGNCAGSCMKQFNPEDYRFRIQLALDVLAKDHTQFVAAIKKKIQEYNKEMAFEKSRNLSHYLENMNTIFATLETHFSAAKYVDQIIPVITPKPFTASISKDIAQQLQTFLATDHPIHTIDCFDISHFQSQQIVGSCIRFVDGKPEKNKFRRFQVKSLIEQNDYAALQEIVSRRYKDMTELPDLIVIDGGKGQLSSVQKVLPTATIISLAKKEERIFGTQTKDGIPLTAHSEIGKLLIELRDYAHHFALSYHRLKQSKSLYEK